MNIQQKKEPSSFATGQQKDNKSMNMSKYKKSQRVKYNTFDKNVNIQYFLNFMQKFTSFLPVWHRNKDGNFTLKSSTKPHSEQEKLIADKLYYYQSYNKKTINLKKTYYKLQFVRDILMDRNLEEEELKKALKICASSLNMLQSVNSEGKTSWYECNAKGTKRYNKIQQGKILDFVEERVKEKKDCVFLTLTCDPAKYGSRSFAWRFYLHSEVYKVTENLRKHYGAEYVATLESTAKGWPHIHMMLFFPRGTFPELKYYHNQQNIRKGRLYDMVCHTVNSEVFNLQSAKGPNLKWYLTKYIGKGVEDDIFKLLNIKGDWKLSDIKQVQEYIYLKAFNRRKLLMTRKGCKSQKNVEMMARSVVEKKFDEVLRKAEALNSHLVSVRPFELKSEDKVNVLLERIQKMKPAHATKLRAYLTSICTNSPLWQDCYIESMSFERFMRYFNRIPDRNNDVKQEEKKAFSFHGRVMVDNRNFIVDFMRFVISPSESAVNRKEWLSFYFPKYYNMFDDCDFSDDKQFLMAIFKAFCFYVEKILVKGCEYREVLEQREDLTNHKKVQYVGRGNFTSHVCASSRESYYTESEWSEVTDYIDMRRMKWKEMTYYGWEFDYLIKNGLITGRK